jgi:hypothetical protein
MIEIKWNHSVI